MPLHTACCETCLASKSCLCAALRVSQPRKHSLAEGFVHQTLNYLFIWGYPGFHLSLQNCWKPLTGLPVWAARQWSEQREAADAKHRSQAAHPSTARCQRQPGQVTEDLLSSVSRSNGCAINRPELTHRYSPGHKPRGLVTFPPVASKEQEHKAPFCHPCS